MGYPKKHRGRRKMGSKKRRARKKNKKKYVLMEHINKAKLISIWIFILPFIAVNTCLILVTQFHSLFPNQVDIIHNTFPYFDGGASISRTARPYPSWLVFKPLMIFTSFLLVKYWMYNREIISFFSRDHKNIKTIFFLLCFSNFIVFNLLIQPSLKSA